MRPAWEDLDAFLDPDDFGVRATIRMQAGAVRHVVGIFDELYLNARIGEYEADTGRPRLLCKESDVAGVARGDVVELGGRTFDVLTSPQQDGTGMAVLDLAQQL